MRTFTLGSGADRKFVVIEIRNHRVRVVQGKADGTSKTSERELASEAQARSVADKMIAELVSRGYVEKGAKAAQKASAATGSAPAKPAKAKPAAARVPAAEPEPSGMNLGYLLEADEAPAEPAGPVLARMSAAAAPATADGEPKKKKANGQKKKKRKKGAGGGDELDKRVLAGAGAAGVLILGIVGYMAYDTLFKPATIVGKWAGSRVEFETGGPMSFAQYDLILDDAKGAAMSVDGGSPSVGTYAFQGDRLRLTFKDEEGEVSEIDYKVDLGSATLDLYDPSSGRKVVQLVRSFDKPKAGSAKKAGPAAPDAGPVAVGEGDKAADARLASVEFAPKDGAFKIKHPPGWEAETGSRPDNTYSWARFTKGSAKIQVFADVTGSLMAGAPDANQEEGSEMAPVHTAHELYRKTISEEYTDYNEGKPAVFKGSALGEGRIAAFTASGGGLFGSKLRGCRVTLLTGDRRITVLCECPDSELKGLQDTFLAVARSVSR